ncbi:hypothetical protein I6A60_36635 [Frankia sp. AgB1.9]|uniref:DUF5685 family protein n=1 Tax=unclassified Frankia TaxID=2632575 RepID=UPI0019330299|nr:MULTISPECIES: DUF5685 family protein [unclassified Frankia]MBL7493222.1 hypothetical protein [Frankia sp. AgW1.1]MBL7553340.1 hypothetical protein [Frankia sp. AgB1.9]MBL7624843.1 hypothetical protein [Frankia sp. AgB1.8]
MFGILRPCRHRLGDELTATWMSHLCGMCLTLRDRHGQWARVATNVDGLLLSVLVAAQTGESSTRKAGPCALRGLRTARVASADDPGARLAATVSLAAAATNVDDHVADGDGAFARRPVAAVAARFAGAATRGSGASGAELGFDVGVLERAASGQKAAEDAAGPGTALTTVTAPAEQATAAAFAHTALLAGQPDNAEPLTEIGRYFGRLAHLLDAVADQREDAARGAWNPLTATGATRADARALCDDALLGIRLALRDVTFAPAHGAASRNPHARLAHLLLVHELERAVAETFRASESRGSESRAAKPDRTSGSGQPGPGQPTYPAPEGPDGPEPGRPGPGVTFGTCLAATAMCCTCQACREHTSPYSGQRRQGICSNCDCTDCGDCCDCCECCGDCGDCDCNC